MKKSAEEIKTMILNFAQLNSSIRAVYLEGSRVNPNFPPDEFQDYDVVFVVQDFENFITNDSWTNIFGEKIIEQQPKHFLLVINWIIFSVILLFIKKVLELIFLSFRLRKGLILMTV